jgi:hypothetical protein
LQIVLADNRRWFNDRRNLKLYGRGEVPLTFAADSTPLVDAMPASIESTFRNRHLSGGWAITKSCVARYHESFDEETVSFGLLSLSVFVIIELLFLAR